MLPRQGRSSSAFGSHAILACVLFFSIAALLLHFHSFRSRIAHLSMHSGDLGGGDPTLWRDRLLEQISKFNADADPTQLIVIGGDTEEHHYDDNPPAAILPPAVNASCPGVKQPADKSYVMRSKAEVEAENPVLAAKLKEHSINNEIMLALANGIMLCQNTTTCWWNGGNILETFIKIMEYNNITNHLIGCLDNETIAYLEKRNTKEPFKVHYFKVDIPIPKSQEKTHPANRVSTIKYTLLMDLIQMGYDTLITDMDLVYMKNPFHHLHRDSDIEIQTDGFNDQAYGTLGSVHDPSMGWGGGGLYITLFTTNVGCMWVSANQRSYTLMKQVHDHLKAKPGWDQQIFNEYLLRPSHQDFQSAGCSLRVLDYMKWMNSKIFFKTQRDKFIPGAKSTAEEPILVHFNYHPDKHRRMLCIVDRYHKKKLDACDKLPGGSEEGS